MNLTLPIELHYHAGEATTAQLLAETEAMSLSNITELTSSGSGELAPLAPDRPSARCTFQGGGLQAAPPPQHWYDWETRCNTTSRTNLPRHGLTQQLRVQWRGPPLHRSGAAPPAWSLWPGPAARPAPRPCTPALHPGPAPRPCTPALGVEGTASFSLWKGDV
jgi:hypothetical protein